MRGTLDKVPTVSEPTAGLLDETFEVALVINPMVLDRLYFGQAGRLDRVIVTVDEIRFNATRAGSHATLFHWLEDPM